MFEGCFPEQRAFVEDDSHFLVLCCSRRASKSYSDALLAVLTACLKPRSNILIMAKTMEAVRDIFIRDIFEVIFAKLKCGVHKRGSPALQYEFPNKSIIQFKGIDSCAGADTKLKGRKLDLVIIDEVQDIANVDLEQVIHRTILPMLVDRRGKLVISGTPGMVKGYFYKICHGQDTSGIPWKLMKWTLWQNPYVAKEQARLLEMFKKGNPDYEKTTNYRREFLGEWVLDDSQRVYVYGPQNLDVNELPSRGLEPTYALGVDMGFNDADAYAVVCWFQDDPTLYFVESFQETRKDIFDQANTVQLYREKYDIPYIVIDGMNKKAVETYRKRFNLELLEGAEQHGKNTHIDLLNADLSHGSVKVLPKARNILPEWDDLVWDKREDKRVEDGRLPNHRSDAFLYAYTKSLHFRQHVQPKDTRTWEQKTQDAIQAEYEERVERWTEGYEDKLEDPASWYQSLD